MGAGRLVDFSLLVHEGDPGHAPARYPPWCECVCVNANVCLCDFLHITSAGRDSSAVAPVVASVVLTFTRDTGTQITQTNLTSIPTHQHDRDDRIRGRLNQKNPLLQGSTEIPGCSHHRVRSEVASAPFRIWCSDVMHACSAGPLPGHLGEPSFTPQGLGVEHRGCSFARLQS